MAERLSAESSSNFRCYEMEGVEFRSSLFFLLDLFGGVDQS